MADIRKLEQEADIAQRASDALKQHAEANKEDAEAALEAAEAILKLAEAKERLALASAADQETLIALIETRKKAKKSVDELSASTDAASKHQQKFAGAAEGLASELHGLVPIIGGNTDIMGSFGGQLAAAAIDAEGLDNGMNQLLGSFLAMFDPVQVFSNLMHLSEEMIAGWVASAITLTLEIQSVNASFNKATGAQGSFNAEMNSAYRATISAGVSYAELADATKALFTQTVKFTNMSKQNRQELMQTTAVLAELGVDAITSAQALNVMTTSLGMNAGEAEVTSRRLATAAMAMGVAPAEMAADFAAAGKQFASFGENAVDAFIDLKEMAKKTGIELQGLLSITEQFTTFEGAAQHVGSLNALLGGPFLNTIDMVNASLEDPVEAMKMVSDAVIDAGMSFDDMSPAMRRAVAEAAGLEDAAQLAALMSGELDGLGGASSASAKQLEELKDATKFTQTLAEELEATRLAFTMSFQPIIEMVISFLDTMQEAAEWMTKNWFPGAPAIAGLLAAGILATASFFGLKWAMRKMLPDIAALSGGMTTLAGALTAVTAAGGPAAGALKPVGKAATMSAGGMLAFGAAVMMVGIGLGLAAAGMAALVLSFSQLSPEQTVAATKALIGLAVGLGVLMAAMVLIAVSPLGQAALIGLLAIGAAIMMIGTGVGIAAAGMSLMVSAIGELAGTADDFVKIGAAFAELSIPKMITYTTAMAATAAVAMTPAGALLLAGTAIAGGVKAAGAGGASQEVKVDVSIEGKMNKLFDVLDKRYTKLGATTAGGVSVPSRVYMGR